MGRQQPGVAALRVWPAGGHDSDRHDPLAPVRARLDCRRHFRERQRSAQGRAAAGRVREPVRDVESRPRSYRDDGPGLRTRRDDPDHRGDAGADRHDRARTRLHGSTRAGRAEPPLPEGAGADARKSADALDMGAVMAGTHSMTTKQIRFVMAGAVALAALCAPPEASAQLDPLMFLKNARPNIILAIDTSARMRLDADGTYYDPAEYTVTGAAWEPVIGVPGGRSEERRVGKECRSRWSAEQ